MSRWLAATTLIAVVLTATVPHFCATGWCCAQHPEQQSVEKPSCCADKQTDVRTLNVDTCCKTATSQTTDNSKCDGGCATGCCRIASTHYVLATNFSVSMLNPLGRLLPGSAIDTGIELTDYIPQPPRGLSA